MEENELNVICFMCNFVFCQKKLKSPSNVSVARVNCIGRIDPVLILEMFENGTDAVMLIGCKPPDCHYFEGNRQTEITVKLLRRIMSLAGLEPERLKLFWYSPLETKSFTRCAKEFLHEVANFASFQLRNLKPESRLRVNILAAKNAVSKFRLRVLLGRERELTESVNVYGEKISLEEFDDLLDDVVESEFVQHKIHVLTRDRPLSVKALAEAVEMKPATVLKQIVNMRRRNMIAISHVEGTTPFYKALGVI